MSIKRLFDAVERRGDIGRRVAALVLPISNRARVTSSCAGKIGLREPGEHTSGPNLASRDNVAHNQTLYTILQTLPPASGVAARRAQVTGRVRCPLTDPCPFDILQSALARGEQMHFDPLKQCDFINASWRRVSLFTSLLASTAVLTGAEYPCFGRDPATLSK